MADIINFNKARKQREREQAQLKAAENRLRFGRSKAQKRAEREAEAEAARKLDGLRRDAVVPGSQRPLQGWALDALENWPAVPALYGWLRLDRRGQWWVRGERITRPQIIDCIKANYAADDRGCWFFQNGPQRGYVELEAAPLILHADGNGELHNHCGEPLTEVRAVLLDETGALWFDSAQGAALLDGSELDWALPRLFCAQRAADEDDLNAALALAPGRLTALSLRPSPTQEWPIERVQRADAAQRLQFVARPDAPDDDRASGPGA